MVTNAPITEVNPFGLPVGRYESPQPLELRTYEPAFSPTPGAIFGAIGNAVKSLFAGRREISARVLRFGITKDYVAAVQDRLWDLIRERRLVTVYTRSRTYNDMLLTRAPMTKRPDLGDAATFALEFDSIRIVKSVSTKVPREIVPKPPLNKGTKNPKEDPPKKTVARQIFKNLTGQ